MSVFGWSLPAGCMWLPTELDNIPPFCDSHCPHDEPPSDCDCNPDKCEAFAIHIHIRSCLVHKETFGDGCSCEGCTCDDEARFDREMREYEKRIKGTA